MSMDDDNDPRDVRLQCLMLAGAVHVTDISTAQQRSLSPEEMLDVADKFVQYVENGKQNQ